MDPNVNTFTILVSSENLTEATSGFVDNDPPPTSMTSSIRLPTLTIPKAGTNNLYKMFIKSYFLNCVWRDSADPSDKLTANTGTSISHLINVTFYVGPLGNNMRLLTGTDRNGAGNTDCDMVIYKDMTQIFELASFSYYTDKAAFDSNYWFENQYTFQVMEFPGDGKYLGDLSATALNALMTTPYITVKMVTNRTDQFISPFWYRKFLHGVSLYKPSLGRYDIVANGEEYLEKYLRVASVTVTKPGGPYRPITFHTIDDPFHSDLYKGTSTITNVSAPIKGCINLLNDSNVEIALCQVSFEGENASRLGDFALTNGLEENGPNTLLLAPSDESGYTVTHIPANATSKSQWTVLSNSTSSASNPTVMNVPLGKWEGKPLRAKPTQVTDYYSPFPWEQSLTAEQLHMINGDITYDPALHESQILPKNNFLFMNTGEWNFNGKRIGERSIQYNLQTEKFVNKIQLLFPRSEERWQPTHLNGTLQRAWLSGDAGTYIDQYPAYWHQGFQHIYPYGKNDEGVHRYMHTLTQQEQVNGVKGCMSLGTHGFDLCSFGEDIPIAVTEHPFVCQPPEYLDPSIQLVHAVQNDSRNTSFVTSPNDETPSHDFRRYEYGPFYQQPTHTWMASLAQQLVDTNKSQMFPIAFCRKWQTPDWSQEELKGAYFHHDFLQKLGDDEFWDIMGGRLYWVTKYAYSFFVQLPPLGYNPDFFRITTSIPSVSSATDIFNGSLDTTWSTGETYSPTTGTYIGTVTTGTSFTGEWIGLELTHSTTSCAALSRLIMYPTYTRPTVLDTAVLTHSGSIDVSYSNGKVHFTTAPVYTTPFGYTGGKSLGGNEGEWVKMEYSSPVSVTGFHVYAPNQRNAPWFYLITGSNDNSTWTTLHYAPGTWGVVEDFVQCDNPGSYKYIAIVCRYTPYVSTITDPYHYFTVFDYRSGREVTVYLAKKHNGGDEPWVDVSLALKAELPGSDYRLLPRGTETDQLGGPGEISNTHNFYIVDTPLARAMGFTGFGPSNPSVVEEDGRFYVQGTVDMWTILSKCTTPTYVDVLFTFYSGTVSTNPAKVSIVGSNDNGSTWSLVGGTTLSNWTSTVPRVVFEIDRSLFFKMFRVVFETAQPNGSGTIQLDRMYLSSDDFNLRNLGEFDFKYTSVIERNAMYPHMYLWFIENFNTYMLERVTTSSLRPMVDYIVKEEYDLAPYYDQTDLDSEYSSPSSVSSTTSFQTYRPPFSSRAQKMVQALFAQGPYFGFAPGYETTNRGYTRRFLDVRDTNIDRDIKCFSWRLCHQLYNFTVTGASVQNQIVNSDPAAETEAQLTKRFEYGMLTGLAVTDKGTKYTQNVGSSQVKLGLDSQVILEGTAQDVIAEKAMELINEENDTSISVTEGEILFTRLPPPHTDFSDNKPMQPNLRVDMEESDLNRYRDVGSTKTPLRRQADFKLTFKRDTDLRRSTEDMNDLKRYRRPFVKGEEPTY